MPKKILVVTSALPFEIGGNLIIAKSLVKKLQEAGFESSLMTVAQNRFGRQSSAYLSARFTDVQKTYLDSEVDQIITFRFPSYAVKHHKHVCWLNHRMREYYDLWDNFYSTIKSPFNKVKEIVRRSLIHKIDNYLLTKNVKKLFAQSKNIQNRLKRFGGIDSEVLYPPPLGNFEYRSESYDDYIFSPSRLTPLKRNSILIKAFSEIKNSNLKCIIAGEGSEKVELEKLIEGLNLKDRIILSGHVGPDKLSEFYGRALAVFFGPYDEDYGLVTLEAMICKKPVITFTDSGGPTELVENDINGFVIDPLPSNLAEIIDLLYNDKNKVKTLGQNGYELSSKISWENTINKLVIV